MPVEEGAQHFHKLGRLRRNGVHTRIGLERPIRVQVRRRGLRVTIEWPTMAADHCAAWLKELLD